MIQKNRPVGDPAKQVEPEVASFFGQGCVDFHGVPFRSDAFVEDQGGGGDQPRGPAEIVTAQHNDYTGLGKCNIQAGESPIKFLKDVSILIPAVSTTRFNAAFPRRGPIIHDRTHL